MTTKLPLRVIRDR